MGLRKASDRTGAGKANEMFRADVGGKNRSADSKPSYTAATKKQVLTRFNLLTFNGEYYDCGE
jgi:hypothetical protein